MKWVYNGTVSEFFYGKRKGIFRKKGFDVELQPGGPGISGTVLVESGTSTFAVTSAEEVIRARSAGAKVKSIATVFQRDPVVFLADKTKDITKPADLAGKTVALVRGDNTELIYYELLAKNHVDRTSIVEKPWTFDLKQFTQGPIDAIPAYVFDQPLILDQQGERYNVITPREHQVRAMGDVLIASEGTLREKPEMVIRFIAAFLDSMEAAIANPDGAVDALISETSIGLDREKELSTWKIASTYVLDAQGADMGAVDKELWEATLNRLTLYGGLDADTAPAIDDCVDSDLVFQARQLHGGKN